MRDLTYEERRILENMFAQLPSIDAELKEQARLAKVIRIDDEGSLRFTVNSSALSLEESEDGVPITAIFDDTDGIPVYILLHIRGGRLFELEIYKADGSKMLSTPVAEKLYF